MEKLETKILAATFSVLCLCLLLSQESQARGGGAQLKSKSQCLGGILDFTKSPEQTKKKLSSWIPGLSSTFKLKKSPKGLQVFPLNFSSLPFLGAKEFRIRTGLSPPAAFIA